MHSFLLPSVCSQNTWINLKWSCDIQIIQNQNISVGSCNCTFWWLGKLLLSRNFSEVAGTYECYFVILWKQLEWWGTQRCWRHSNSTYCNHISLTFLHSQAVGMLKHLLAPCSSQSHLVNFLLPNISQKMKIVKNPSRALLHCTFTMYGLKVHSISQWWSLCIKEDGFTSWSIHCIVSY